MARSDLVNHPMVTGAGSQKNHWYNYPDYQMATGPGKPRYVIGADPAEAFGELALLNAKRGARRLADQIWIGVCDSRAPQPSPRRPRRDIPLWAAICFPTAAGLAVGALLYLLRP